jgi:hypothetical protein
MALGDATGERKFEVATHAVLTNAAEMAETSSLGLFDGIAGLRAAASIAAKREPHYAALLSRCDAFLDAAAASEARGGAAHSTFDLVSGWSGARLARCIDGPTEPDRVFELAAAVLADELRWRRIGPLRAGGAEDAGMAFGLAGALAAVALTLDDPSGLRELLVARAWQLACCIGEARPPQRDAAEWCSGIPGVAAALHAVSRRTGDRQLERLALDALARLGARPTRDWSLSGPGICHGTLGAALVFAGVGAASGVATLARIADRLLVETVEDIVANGSTCTASGDAGVILGLLTLTRDFDPGWMRCHGLEPLPSSAYCNVAPA